ncbi:MAG: hypothetical protein IH600_08725 [Bacteroidetes bacterium]|nr:hypothetical protein [Bacteroidota bacterium]
MRILTPEKRKFVEETAKTCEQMFGLSRMAGRIWAVLLIADKEFLSSDELMECVGASRGSVSTLARMLEGIGLIKRVSVHGDRKHYYRAADSESIIQAELASTKTFIQLMTVGIKAAGKEGTESRKRLSEFRDLMQFFADEYASLVERWYNQKEKA